MSIDPTRAAGAEAPPREANRLVSLAAAVLLGGWCVAGAQASATRFIHETHSVREARAAGSPVVGIPLAGAADVGVLRHVLKLTERTGDAPWLVLLPAAVPATMADYIRAQLAYSEYPRRVDVAQDGEVRGDVGYGGVVVVPGAELAGGGEPAGVIGGYRLYLGAR